MTTTICNCCREQIPSADNHNHDSVLGHICDDCHAGAEEGTHWLRKAGVVGIFIGKCPDQPEGLGS